MLRYFYNQLFTVFHGNVDCVVNLWQAAFRELYIQDGANNLSDFTYILFCHFLLSLLNVLCGTTAWCTAALWPFAAIKRLLMHLR